MKTCSKCNTHREFSEFYRDKSKVDGLHTTCKVCRVEYDSSSSTKSRIAEYKTSGKRSEVLKNYNSSDRGKACRKKYFATPKGKTKARSLCAKRRAHRIHAVPKWLTQHQLDLMEIQYQTAEHLTRIFGIPHEVDHIIPLQGKTVCGLHVPWNLRVITREQNRKDGNKGL